MASKLKGKNPKDAEPSKPKILIFGSWGVGKTWGALDFPSCYFIDPAGGANLSHYTDKLKKSGGVYMGIEDGASDPETILEQITALKTETHPHRTLIIDDFSSVAGSIQSKEQTRIGLEADKYSASKKPAILWVKRVVSAIQNLDMTVILIAHEKEKYEDNKSVGQTFDVQYDKLGHDLHLALQIVRQGSSRYAIIRKTRLDGGGYNFPDGGRFIWSYEEFANRYGREVIEREAKPVVLASPEQVKKVNVLLETIRITPEEIDKWFAKAQVDSFSEMTTEVIEKIIVHLQSKVTGAA